MAAPTTPWATAGPWESPWRRATGAVRRRAPGGRGSPARPRPRFTDCARLEHALSDGPGPNWNSSGGQRPTVPYVVPVASSADRAARERAGAGVWGRLQPRARLGEADAFADLVRSR
ncbi:hypothetical protein Srut_56020 [Streptomyces rutgersensis]|uniref:Uncharacterized protein n=1 Tax=Streptomyces gougerotii TaxID=53448 RepID=A0A8H9HA30_9ACTN|nr:hypothetical protein Srut_56020 [Streptomyces rutgersensis]GGU51701.1 hypothetical protein GCM10010227_00280 [Streptomyces gougerotii]